MNEQFQYKASSFYGNDTKTAPINLDEAKGIVECFVAGIGNKDSVGDIVVSGAFSKSLQRRKPRVVWGHNWNDPIGKVLDIYEVSANDPRLPMKMKIAGIGGLFAQVQFNLTSEKGKEAFANVAFFGEEQEWSIGYKTLRAQFDQKTQANIIYELELYEVSPVLHGANQLTGTISVKTDGLTMTMPMGPNTEVDLDREEIEKQLSQMFGAKVSVMNVDDNEVTFARSDGPASGKKYKCGYTRRGRGFLFGMPEPVAQPVPNMGMPSMEPLAVQPMPMQPHGPTVEPRRVVRPSQMPSIPVAIKPGENGVVMVALPPVSYSNNTQPEIDKNNLDKEEADLRDALRKIVKRHGKFDETGDGVWAGYYPPEKNPVANIGVKCANCVFYKGGSSCEILALDVHPEGKCRFAVIPNGVVKGFDIGSRKTFEQIIDHDAENYIKDIETKYPGEFILGMLRGAVGRRKKRRRKYAMISEFDEENELSEKGYLIPLDPRDAFMVKQALDPVLDYHNVSNFVDEEGIVLTSNVTHEFIDAVDTAMENIKKKILNDPELKTKAIGKRIGSYAASRAIDRPTIGGRRNRGRGDGPTGGIAGELDPRGMSMVDFDRDGWAREGSTNPVWVGIQNEGAIPLPSPKNRDTAIPLPSPKNRDTAIPMPQFGRDDTAKPLPQKKKKPSADDWSWLDEYKQGKNANNKINKFVDSQRSFSSGNDEKKSPFADEKTLKKNIAEFAKGTHNNRDVERHLGPDQKKFSMSNAELDARREHEAIADQWIGNKDGWITIPWSQPDKFRSPDYLRGRELGYNQTRIKWQGDGVKRPDDFNEKATGGAAYAQWYHSFVGSLGGYLKAFGDDRENDQFWEGLEDAFHQDVYNKRPEVANWPEEVRKSSSDWMRQNGFDPGSPKKPKKQKIERPKESLSSGGQGAIPLPSPKNRDTAIPLPSPKNRDTAIPLPSPVFSPFVPTKGYAKFLKTPEGERSEKDNFKYYGPAWNAAFSSGAKEETLSEESDTIKNLYAEMTARVLKALEEAMKNPGQSWNVPWRQNPDMFSRNLLRNTSSNGHIYEGDNQLILQDIASKRGYTLGRWAGAKQWEVAGGKMKPGSVRSRDGSKLNKAVPILAPIYDGPRLAGLKLVYVYNVAEVDGLPERFYKPSAETEKLSEDQKLEIAENVIQELNPSLRFKDEGRAYYAPGVDRITMPKFEDFKSAIQYYATLMHETVHWTGHPSRNNRPQDGRRKAPDGSPPQKAYAREELVAEIGSAFLMGIMGLEPQVREDHAVYLKSWFTSLQQEPNALKNAIKQAQDAIDWMIARSPSLAKAAGYDKDDKKDKKGKFINRSLPMLEGYEDSPQVPPSGAIRGTFEDIGEDDEDGQALSSGNRTLWVRGDGGGAPENRVRGEKLARERERASSELRIAEEEKRTLGKYTPEGEREVARAAARRAKEQKKRGVRSSSDTSGDEEDEQALSSGGRVKRTAVGALNKEAEINKQLSKRPIRDGDSGIYSFRSAFDSDDYVPEFDEIGRVMDMGGRSMSSGNIDMVPAAKAKAKVMGPHKGKKPKPLKRSTDEFSFALGLHLDYEPTGQQRDVVDAVTQVIRKQNEDGAFVTTINAGAGTGKTTTLRAISRALLKEFSMVDKTGRPLPDDQKRAKLASIGAKYYEEGKSPDWSKMSPEEITKELDNLSKKHGVNDVYYIVFNRKNQEEAEVTFDNNTGVATLDKLAYHSLKNGGGDKRYGTNPKTGKIDPVLVGKFQTKMEMAMGQKGGNFKKTQDYFGTHFDGRTISVKGRKPNAAELGYTVLGDAPGEWIDYLDLAPKVAKQKNGVMDFGSTYDASDPRLITGRALLDATDLALVIKNALGRWANDPTEKAEKKHFVLAAHERESDASLTQVRMAKPIQMGDALFSEESIPDEAVALLQKLIDDMLDSSSPLLPRRNIGTKMWALTDPDLRTDPGLVSHVKNEESYIQSQKINDGKTYKVNDVWVDPKTGKEWVITKINPGKSGQNVQMRKRFGTKDRPLSAFFIDEAQDMNPIMRRVIELNRDRIPIVMVGDDAQSVYGFRAAENLMQTVGGDYDLDITESFRYGDRIAYLGNAILQRRARYLRAIGEEDQWKHVVGAATDVITNNFDLSTAKTPSARADKLLRIQRKYVDPRNKANNTDIAVLDMDKSSDKTELKKYLQEIMDEELEASRGGIVNFAGNGDRKPGAILTASNRGIFSAALSFALTWTLDPKNAGSSPIISIPEKKHQELVAFYKHAYWIMVGSTKGFNKPPESPWLTGIWTQPDLRRHMASKAGSQARAAWRIHEQGIPGTPFDRTQIPFGTLIRMLEGDHRNVPPVEAIIKPERNLRKFFSQIEVPAGDLLERAARRTAGIGSVTKGSSQLEKWEVIPPKKKDGIGAVWFQLQLDGRYGKDFGGAKIMGKDTPGKWTGNVIITGQGVDNLRSAGANPDFPNHRGNGSGAYRDDINKIIKELGLEDRVKTINSASVDDGKAMRPPFDGFMIMGDKDKPEETAQIMQTIAKLLRERAEHPGGDIEVTTAQLAKGREWDGILLAEDFKTPEDQLPTWLTDDPALMDLAGNLDFNAIIAKLEKMAADQTLPKDAKTKQYIEALNVAYVAVTRAKKFIDPGAAFSQIYFKQNDFDLADGEIKRGVDARKAALIARPGDPSPKGMPERVMRPDDFDPLVDRLDAPPDPNKPKKLREISDIFDVPDDFVPDGMLEGDDTPRVKKKGRPKKGEVRVDEQDEDDNELIDEEEAPDTNGDDDILDDLDKVDDKNDNTAPIGKDEIDNTGNSLSSGAVVDKNKSSRLAVGALNEVSEISSRKKRKLLTGSNEQYSGDSFDDIPQIGINDTFQFESEEDAERMDELISWLGRAGNTEWANNIIDSNISSPEQQSVARGILDSPQSMSSGRSERRVIKTMEDVQATMEYDWEKAGFRFTPTPEQQNVSDAIMTGEDVIVRALAGTGKTSTLELVAQRLSKQEPDKKIIYLVFNNKNQAEAAAKFAKFGNVEVRTWDSVAYRAIIGKNERLRKKMDSNTDGLVLNNNYDGLAEHYSLASILVGGMKEDGSTWSESIDRKNLAYALSVALNQYAISDDTEIRGRHLVAGLERAGVPSSEVSKEDFAKLLSTAKQMWKDGFDEKKDLQLSRSWLVKAYGLTNPDMSTGHAMDKHMDGNDILFFDEAQDANSTISKIVTAQKMQKVIVGDSNQAIMEFRGSRDELDSYKAKYQLTLTESFRFNDVIAGYANRFLSIHQYMHEERNNGRSPASSKLRLKGKGPNGAVVSSVEDIPGYPDIFSAANRETNKDGKKDTLAFLSNTNGAAFELILEQQALGRVTGSVEAFKKDLIDMLNHADWLKSGKPGKKPVSRFAPFNEFQTWADLVKAAAPNDDADISGEKQLKTNNVQAITAYRIMAKQEFNFGKMRQAVEDIITVDNSESVVRTDEVTEDMITPGNIIPIILNGTMDAEIGNGQINLNKTRKEAFDEFMSKKPIFAGRLGFKWDATNKVWSRKYSSPSEATKILNDLSSMLVTGIKIEGGADSPFNDRAAVSKAITSNGTVNGFFSEIGSPGSGIKFSKTSDGKIKLAIEGDTYKIIGDAKSKFKQKFKDTRIWRWDGDKKQWYASADNEDDAFKKLTDTRSAMGIASGGGEDGAWIVKPQQSPEDAATPKIDLVAQTAHRSKGLEFDIVIMGEDFKSGVKDKEAGDDEEEIADSDKESLRKKMNGPITPEDVRLQYVAATRAMKYLYPGSAKWIEEVTDEDDAKYIEPVSSLSSGNKTNRKNRRTGQRAPWDEESRQNFADGNILRSKKVPKKRKEGPSVGEFSSGGNTGTPEPQTSPANTGSRINRRLRNSNTPSSMSSGNYDGASAIRMSGMLLKSPSEDTEFAMRFWEKFRERGIPLDTNSNSKSRALRGREVMDGLRAVKERIQKRQTSIPEARVMVGDIRDNNPMEQNSASTWMLSVSRLREAIRIPIEFDDNGRPTQTRQMSVAELGTALNLPNQEIEKLNSDFAGINHESVRYLIAELGNQPEFVNWKLFSPTTNDEPGMESTAANDRFLENLARGAMRDRFIKETFGKDAYPFWYDAPEDEIVSAEEFSTLGEVDPTAKFLARGRFNGKKTKREDGESNAEVELMIEGQGGEEEGIPSIPVSPNPKAETVSRSSLPVTGLLKSLGIDESTNWAKELRSQMQTAFGLDDVGLDDAVAKSKWEKEGVPIAYIAEMIRTGMIPSASEIYPDNGIGEKLDKELLATKPAVTEAFFDFMRANFGDSKLNGRVNRDSILGFQQSEQQLESVLRRFKESGNNFSKNKGDERRYSSGQLGDIVNRFNKMFGTNYTIDDIFSDEQLRNAKRRIEQENIITRPTSAPPTKRKKIT